MSPLDNEVVTALRAVILDYGWSVTARPARLRAALNDAFGADAEDRRGDIDSLAVAAEEGIATDVRTLTPADAPTRVPEFERRLVDWGMTPERARSVVRAWLAVSPNQTYGALTTDPIGPDQARRADTTDREPSTDREPPMDRERPTDRERPIDRERPTDREPHAGREPATETPRPRPVRAQDAYSAPTALRSDPTAGSAAPAPGRPGSGRAGAWSRNRRLSLVGGGAGLIIAVVIVLVVVTTGGSGSSPKASATCGGKASSGACSSGPVSRSSRSESSPSSSVKVSAAARLSGDEQALVARLPRNLRVDNCVPVSRLETLTLQAAVDCRVTAGAGKSPTALRAYRFASTSDRAPFVRDVLRLFVLPKGPCLDPQSLRTTWHYAGPGRNDLRGDPTVNGGTNGGGLFCYRLQSKQYLLWDYVDPAYPVTIQAWSTTMSKRELYDWWRGHAIR